MIYLLAAVPSVIVLCGWFWLSAGEPHRRHTRCLQNIERLEHELFPEWFREFDGWSGHYAVERPYVSARVDWMRDLDVRPGAVWKVDSHNDIRPYVRSIPPAQMLSYAESLQVRNDLAARNLAFSTMWPHSEQQ